MSQLIPIIIDYYSPDIEQVWKWQPDDPKKVYFLLEIEIGLQGKNGSDLFQLIIATPNALADIPFSSMFGRGILIVKRYGWPEVQVAIEEILEKCQGDEWINVASKLNKYFIWEYDDHQYEDV